MRYVTDRSGQQKPVPDGYILQDGESYSIRVPMLMMDGKSADATTVEDGAELWTQAVFDAAGVSRKEPEKSLAATDEWPAGAYRFCGMRPSPKPPALVVDADDPCAAALAYVNNLRSQWRG